MSKGDAAIIALRWILKMSDEVAQLGGGTTTRGTAALRKMQRSIQANRAHMMRYASDLPRARGESGAVSPGVAGLLSAISWSFVGGMLLAYALGGHSAAPAGRHYHPMPLAQMAQAAPGDPIVPTHVVTYGTVRLVRQEADGDLHVRLCAQDDPATCIVLECIPEVPCKAPRYGDHVTAQGISRWDTAHRWQEIHPVLSLEVDK